MKKWALGLILVVVFGVVLALSSILPAYSAIGDASFHTTQAVYSTQQQMTATPSPYHQSHVQMTATAVSTQLKSLPDTGGGGMSQPVPEEAPQQERIVIYSANLRIVADAPDAVVEQIGILIQDLGGWIVTSNSNSQGNNRTYGSITVRVPAGSLDYAIETIKSYGVSVISENISGNDVTSQYVDMSSRLKNLQASEAQLLDIMQDADDVEEVLSVFMELTRIRGNIESIQGQLNYYDQSSTFSSLSVSVDPLIPTPTPYVESAWNPSHTVDKALIDLENNVQSMIDGTIRFVIVGSPFALLLLFAGGLVWMVRRRKR